MKKAPSPVIFLLQCCMMLGRHTFLLGTQNVGMDTRRSSALVAQKAQAAQQVGLITIICVGEDEETRNTGDALAFVEAQVRRSLPPGAMGARTLIAYEPVWAIGSGRAPSSDDIVAMHGRLHHVVTSAVHEQPEAVRFLYGGSVTPSNAAGIMGLDHVDGVLVGGQAYVPMISVRLSPPRRSVCLQNKLKGRINLRAG